MAQKVVSSAQYCYGIAFYVRVSKVVRSAQYCYCIAFYVRVYIKYWSEYSELLTADVGLETHNAAAPPLPNHMC